MIPAADVMPSRPNGREVRQVVGVPALQADDDEQGEHAELDQHHHRVDLGRLARAADQQQRAQHDQDDRRDVEDAALLRRLRDRRRGS